MKKILLLIFIISVSLYGQSVERVTGTIIWGSTFLNDSDYINEKHWYGYAVYDEEKETFVSKSIATNQNLFEFRYKKGDRNISMIFIYTMDNNGIPTNTLPIRLRASRGNTTRDTYRIFNSDSFFTFYSKQEHELCSMYLDHYGDPYIYEWRKFNDTIRVELGTVDIAYMRKAFNFNKGKKWLTKRIGLFRHPKEYLYFLVFETEIFNLDSTYDGRPEPYTDEVKLENIKKIINDPQTRQYADLRVVSIFLQFGETFEKRWEELFNFN